MSAFAIIGTIHLLWNFDVQPNVITVSSVID